MYTTVMQITIHYDGVYIHDRNANNYSIWVSIHTTIMQITIHYDNVYIHDCNANNYSQWVSIYTTVMQITIPRAEWKTLGGLLTPMPLSTYQWMGTGY